jgi:hypothetical protein
MRHAAGAASGSAAPKLDLKQSTRRNSSGESRVTGQSDPKSWFDRSNRNAEARYDPSGMDVDPPFFQKATESSDEGNQSANHQLSYAPESLQVPLNRPTVVTHSSSADDYRSVIDDLTIENQRLKEELKRYKQFGPDLLRKERLFEIKVHGLPKRKKRELENTLRNFAASLGGGSTDASSQQFLKPPRHTKNKKSSAESHSKHESSSSSRSRPADSAYASMSTGPSSSAAHSSGLSLHQPPSLPRAKGSGSTAENHLRDIPEGLYPKHSDLSENEKKKVVVRRLEQLFTGTAVKRRQDDSISLTGGEHAVTKANLEALPEESTDAPSREAQIQVSEAGEGRENRSQEDLSASQSGDQTDSRDNGAGSGRESGERSGKSRSQNNSPSSADPPEQRPTRPFDLDPDRVQVGADNMDYIRHLGLIPPELLVEKTLQHKNVSADADGWVYINLLSSMAQLHMLNVTPEFIRQAVSEKSTKFQVSPDRRKIRWRGSRNGTKFSSDSSGENSQRSPSTDDTDGSNHEGQRKRRKSESAGTKLAPSSKNASGAGKQASASSDSFHYKPLFVHQSSSNETSWEGTGSQASYGMPEDSNPGNTSGWGISGSGSTNPRRKRKHDGAVIYYNGAPFCTDFSGDPGDMSPAALMENSARELQAEEADADRPQVTRSFSGSSLPFRPITEKLAAIVEQEDVHLIDSPPGLEADDSASDDSLDADFPWSSEGETSEASLGKITLDASGLGGILPDDHFAVLVTTRRPIVMVAETEGIGFARQASVTSGDTTNTITGRLAQMSTKSQSSPSRPKLARNSSSSIEVEYLKGRVQRMLPAPLPPPAMFYPPFSSDSDSETSEDEEVDLDLEGEDDEDNLDSDDPSSDKANPHVSDNEYPDHADLSSDDEEDEVDIREGYDDSTTSRKVDSKLARPPVMSTRMNSGSTGVKSMDAGGLVVGSSAATAGGEESGYSSSMEED